MALTLALSQRERGIKKRVRNSSLSLRERVRVMKSPPAPIVARFSRVVDL